MTAYAAVFTWTATSTQKLSVVPSSTYQIRVARVEVNGLITGGSQFMSYQVLVYPSNAATSGSTITPLPMRAGSPAATAVAKSNPTISGTSYQLHSEILGGSPVDALGNAVYAGMNSSYSSPFDLILSSGSTIVVQGVSIAAGTAPMSVVIYFEELRLAWSG